MSQHNTNLTSRSHEMHHGAHGHGWMMIICCIPMLVIAAILVATGVASAGFLFVAVMCTVMMFVMMRAMGGSNSRHDT